METLLGSSLVHGTFNVANALVDADKTDKVLYQLRKGMGSGSSVAVCALPEALPADYSEELAVIGRFARAGYDLYAVNNDDADHRLDARKTGLAIRQDLQNLVRPHVARMKTRNAWQVDYDPELLGVPATFFGLHLDDRNDAARLEQLRALPLGQSLDAAQIIAADINATYPDAPFAGFWHGLAKMSTKIPEADPQQLTGNLPTPGRLRSIIRRMDEITHSEVMPWLEAAGFEDADPTHTTTNTRLGFFKLALDRIMVSASVTVLDSQVAPKIVGDHQLVMADLAAAN